MSTMVIFLQNILMEISKYGLMCNETWQSGRTPKMSQDGPTSDRQT